jgi:hypothetical protein
METLEVHSIGLLHKATMLPQECLLSSNNHHPALMPVLLLQELA